MNSNSQPVALLLVSPHCQYCRAMHKTLDELVESGNLAKLTVVDIAEQPEVAERLGVRSVPWLRIDGFVLEGSHTPGEIIKWIEASKSESGWSDYLAHLLDTGRLALAERLVNEDTDRLPALIPLAGNPETPMHVRVGIAAILEGLQGSTAIRQLLPILEKLANSNNSLVRADACHYLALTGAKEAIPVLKKYTNDENRMVREIATEGVVELDQSKELH